MKNRWILAHRSSLGALAAAWIGMAACSGDVIHDPGAQGGSATTTSTTAASTSTGTTTFGIECSGTHGVDGEAILHAEACDPASQNIQCSGKALIHDLCGCLVIADEADAQAVDEANTAWSHCVSQGCCGPAAHPITPPPCKPCPPAPSKGYCDPMTSLCASGP